MQVDPVKSAKNRAYPFVEEQQKALDEGRITEVQWFDNYNRYFTANYLAADNPRAQSGHGGDEARWRYSRGMIGGRLIIGLCDEERDSQELEEKVRAWGYQPAGYCEKFKPDNEIVSYKMLWIDVD